MTETLNSQAKKSVLVTLLHVVGANFCGPIPQSENNRYTKIKRNCNYNTTLCFKISHMILLEVREFVLPISDNPQHLELSFLASGPCR